MCPKDPWRTAERVHRSGTWWSSSGSLGWRSLMLPWRTPEHLKKEKVGIKYVKLSTRICYHSRSLVPCWPETRVKVNTAHRPQCYVDFALGTLACSNPTHWPLFTSTVQFTFSEPDPSWFLDTAIACPQFSTFDIMNSTGRTHRCNICSSRARTPAVWQMLTWHNPT